MLRKRYLGKQLSFSPCPTEENHAPQSTAQTAQDVLCAESDCINKEGRKMRTRSNCFRTAWKRLIGVGFGAIDISIEWELVFADFAGTRLKALIAVPGASGSLPLFYTESAVELLKMDQKFVAAACQQPLQPCSGLRQAVHTHPPCLLHNRCQAYTSKSCLKAFSGQGSCKTRSRSGCTRCKTSSKSTEASLEETIALDGLIDTLLQARTQEEVRIVS